MAKTDASHGAAPKPRRGGNVEPGRLLKRKRMRTEAAAGAALCKFTGAGSEVRASSRTAWELFRAARIRSQRPGEETLSSARLARIASAEWRQMSTEERAPFELAGAAFAAAQRALQGQRCKALRQTRGGIARYFPRSEAVANTSSDGTAELHEDALRETGGGIKRYFAGPGSRSETRLLPTSDSALGSKEGVDSPETMAFLEAVFAEDSWMDAAALQLSAGMCAEDEQDEGHSQIPGPTQMWGSLSPTSPYQASPPPRCSSDDSPMQLSPRQSIEVDVSPTMSFREPSSKCPAIRAKSRIRECKKMQIM
mmetsp:Transcript_46928/g.77917  ORF Transcript_46928/g.77917 Transcript_46928/m.77917 type:complete len:310 (-) Transcript_46928:67-996(-)